MASSRFEDDRVAWSVGRNAVVFGVGSVGAADRVDVENHATGEYGVEDAFRPMDMGNNDQSSGGVLRSLREAYIDRSVCKSLYEDGVVRVHV